jgi:hypothetical protein
LVNEEIFRNAKKNKLFEFPFGKPHIDHRTSWFVDWRNRFCVTHDGIGKLMKRDDDNQQNIYKCRFDFEKVIEEMELG